MALAIRSPGCSREARAVRGRLLLRVAFGGVAACGLAAAFDVAAAALEQARATRLLASAAPEIDAAVRDGRLALLQESGEQRAELSGVRFVLGERRGGMRATLDELVWVQRSGPERGASVTPIGFMRMDGSWIREWRALPQEHAGGRWHLLTTRVERGTAFDAGERR